MIRSLILLILLLLGAGCCWEIYGIMREKSPGPSFREDLQRLRYRARYWWRRVCHFLGFCPACGDRVNRTRTGRAICPSCGAR